MSKLSLFISDRNYLEPLEIAKVEWSMWATMLGKVLIICGPQSSGKTTFVSNITSNLENIAKFRERKKIIHDFNLIFDRQITEEYLNSDLILSHEVDGVNNLLHFIRIIKSQLFPSKVLVEGAFNKCFVSGKITIANRGIERNNFLTTPITLNIEENGK